MKPNCLTFPAQKLASDPTGAEAAGETTGMRVVARGLREREIRDQRSGEVERPENNGLPKPLQQNDHSNNDQRSGRS